jgi:hypothetical protein
LGLTSECFCWSKLPKLVAITFIIAGKAPPPGKAWQQPGKDPPSKQPSKWHPLPEWANDDAGDPSVGTFDSSGKFTASGNSADVSSSGWGEEPLLTFLNVTFISGYLIEVQMDIALA